MKVDFGGLPGEVQKRFKREEEVESVKRKEERENNAKLEEREEKEGNEKG